MNLCIVGCGGIGCEVAKLVACSSARYASVAVIDMDTVELSNINRQFLYSRDDVGREKAHATADYLREKAPTVKVSSYSETIINPKRFGLRFFSQYDVIVACLDAFAPRRYVGEMCWLSNRLLVDAGTSGLSGSVTGYPPTSYWRADNPAMECYNCYNRDIRIEIPICTMKNKPTRPEHCVSYSILLAQRMYDVDPYSELIEYAPINSNGSTDEVLSDLVRFLYYSFNTHLSDNPSASTVLTLEEIEQAKQRVSCLFGAPESEDGLTQPCLKHTLSSLTYTLHEHMSTEQTLKEVLVSAVVLARSIASNEYAFTTYDRNNPHLVTLVSGLALLRMHSFGITTALTPFELSTLAGSIVPAVTFTNAAVAALAMKLAHMIFSSLLAKQHHKESVLLQHFIKNSRRSLLISDDLRPPNPECAVCGIPYYILTVKDSSFLSIDTIIECLSKELSATISAIYGDDVLIYEDDVPSGWTDNSSTPESGEKAETTKDTLQSTTQIYDGELLKITYSSHDQARLSVRVMVQIDSSIKEAYVFTVGRA